MTEQLIQPESLLRRLKPSCELETIPVSHLARKGTEVLSRITETSEAVAVQVQGVGAMVTLSRRQYDELVALVNRVGVVPEEDGFTEALSARFDALVEQMNRPGAEQTVDDALFDDVDRLAANYRPGATETNTP